MSLSILETANRIKCHLHNDHHGSYKILTLTVVLMLYRPIDSSVDGGNVRIESFPKCCFTRDTSTFRKRKK